MPIVNNWIPPTSKIKQTREGQPATEDDGSIKARIIIIKIPINAPIQNNMPNTEAIARGAVVNATIPSIEYLNNFQKLHFVSPAARSMFSYSNHLVRYPTQLKIPFEKRLY